MIACCRRLTRKGRTDDVATKGMKNVFAVSPFVIGFLENRLCALAALFYRVTYKVVRKSGFSVTTKDSFIRNPRDVMICRMLSFHLRHGSNLWLNRSFRHSSPFPIRTIAICSFLPRPEKFLPRRQTMQTIPSFLSLLCIVSKFSVSSDGGVSHLRSL